MPFCDYWSAQIYGATFDNLPLDLPTSILVALWIGNPGSGLLDGNEVTGNNYSRAATGLGDWQIDVAQGNYENTVAITFPEAVGGDWAMAPDPVSHVVLMNQVGNGLFYGTLVVSKEIPEGSIPRFDIGYLTVTLF